MIGLVFCLGLIRGGGAGGGGRKEIVGRSGGRRWGAWMVSSRTKEWWSIPGN